MNEQLKASAKLAREFLGIISEGIGKVESGAGDFSRHAATLARRLPARFSGHRSSSTSVLSTLVIAGVVAGTAALIYSRTKSGQAAIRRQRRKYSGHI